MRASELSGTRLVRTRTVTSHSNRTPSDQILYAFAKPVIESSEVGSMLKGAENELIGEYIFRDVKLNPTFKDDTFTREAVAK